MDGANGWKPVPPASYEGVWEKTTTLDSKRDERAERIAFLEEYRPVLIRYMQAKADAADWHGVQDAASDLRDLDCELDGLRY